MTLEIPPDIPQWAVFAAAGETFPRMDEVGMRVVHELLLDALQASERASSVFDRLLTRLELSGESQAISAAMQSGREIRQACGELTTGLGSLASHVEQAAEDGEFTKVVIITALSQLVAQVWVAVLFPPGAAAADLQAFGAARVAVRQAIERLVARLGGRGLKLVALAGAAQGALPNLVAQLHQISRGHRHGIDLGSLGVNMVAGGVGGLAGHGVAQRLMPALNRIDQRYVTKLPEKWLQKAARGGEVLAVIGAAGAAGGTAGSVAASVVSDQELSLTQVVSAAGGGISGSIVSGAGHVFRPAGSPGEIDAGARDAGGNGADPHDDLIAQQAWTDAVSAQHAAARQLPGEVSPVGAAEPAATVLADGTVDGTHISAGKDPGSDRAEMKALDQQGSESATIDAREGATPLPAETIPNTAESGGAGRGNRAYPGPVGDPGFSGDRTGQHGAAGRGGRLVAEVATPQAAPLVSAPATNPPPPVVASEVISSAAQPMETGSAVDAGAIAGDHATANPAQPSTISDSQDARAASSETVSREGEAAEATRIEPQEEADGGAPTDKGEQPSSDDHSDVEGLSGRDSPSAEGRLKAAAEEILSDYHARSGELVPETMRLNDMPEQVLRFGLLHGGEHDSLLAAIETVRRHTGKLLYREQLMGVLAMRDGLIPEMAPGSGKTLTAAVHNVWTAIHRGPTLLVTSSDPLAYEAYAENNAIFGESGVKFLRIDPDRPVPAPQPGEPTVYIATQDALGFAELRGHLDEISFTSATIDEIDAALFYMNPTYVISDGAVLPASAQTAQAIVAARDFVDDAFASTALTKADFGRDPALPGSPARLTDEGSAKARRLWKGRMTDDDVRRINAAAAVALGDFVEGDHFVMHDGRPVIIDQFSHKVMRDPRTATESRWHDIAPAIEAAMAKKYDTAGLEHTITIHGNSETSKSTTLGEVLHRRVQSLTGTSGTVMNVADTISTVYGTGEAVTIPRTKQHRLEYSDALFVDDQNEKQAALIGNVIDTLRNDNSPQLVLTHRNSDVARIAAGLERFVPTESIRAVDAKWILDQGVHWEDRLHEIVENAGEPGKITIINMQGARGNDYKVHDEVAQAGGMVAHLYGYSALSRDVDAQAENRVARNGQRGRVYHYSAFDDALFDRPGPPNAQLVITQYRDTTNRHHNDHRTALDQARNQVLDLVSTLQQQSLHQLKTQFLHINTTGLVDALGSTDTTQPAPAAPGHLRTQVTTAPEPATTNGHHRTGQPDMPPGHSDDTRPLTPPTHHTTDATSDPASIEHTRAADPDPRDIDALHRPTTTTEGLLAQARELAPSKTNNLQPSAIWPVTAGHPASVSDSASVSDPDESDSHTVEPTDPRRDASPIDSTETPSYLLVPNHREGSGVALPEHSPPYRSTAVHFDHEPSGTSGEHSADQTHLISGRTPWSHALILDARSTPPPRPTSSRPSPRATPWAIIGRDATTHTTPWSSPRVAASDANDLPGFDMPELIRRQEVETARWQAEQVGDSAELTELQVAVEQTGTLRLTQLLDASATISASSPIRRDTPPELDGVACAMMTALLLRDLQSALSNKWVTSMPRMLSGETRADPSAWSYVLGGHGERLPGGEAGHRRVENFLLGLHDHGPGRAEGKQRADYHGRVAVMMDREGPNSAHTYLVVNWRGTPFVIDPYRYDRPVRFDPRHAQSVQAVRVVKFEADGTPFNPIITELTAEPLEVGRRGTTIGAPGRTERLDHAPSYEDRKDRMPAVAGIDKPAHVSTFDELWQRHSGAVHAEVARSYTDTALVNALVDEVRELAINRMPLRDHSSDPAAWLIELAAAVANNPVGWAARARRGMVAALEDAEREVLEPNLTEATAAVLASVVDHLDRGRRKVVELLSGQPELLQEKGFPDEVVRDTVRTVAGASILIESTRVPPADDGGQTAATTYQTPEESAVLQRLRTGGPITESDHPSLTSALAKTRARLQGNASLLRRAEAYLLGPGERLIAGEAATVSVPMDWLPTWFVDSGSTAAVPGGLAVPVVSALRSAVRRLAQDQADYLRMRLAGLSAREVVAVMGLSEQRGWELHNVANSKIATSLVRAALASDPNLLQRGARLLGPEVQIWVEQIVSGERELPAGDLERFWEPRQPIDDRLRHHYVVSRLGEICLAEWAPVVVLGTEVGSATATALRTIAARLAPARVNLLRLMLWLTDEQLALLGYDHYSDLVDKVFSLDQQYQIGWVIRQEYQRNLLPGPILRQNILLLLPRALTIADGLLDHVDGWPYNHWKKIEESRISAIRRPLPSVAVRRSGRGSDPWPEGAATSMPDPSPATPAQSRSAEHAVTALVAGAAWASLTRDQIDALVRARPQDVLATDAPWPVRHAASMMLLVRDRDEVWDGSQNDLAIKSEQQAARAEIDGLAVRSLRQSETVAAWYALRRRVAILGDPWRAWLVSYDPRTGTAVMAVTNSADATRNSMVAHIVSEGSTPRYQFSRAVEYLVGGAQRADGNTSFATLALIGDRIGDDPFRGAMVAQRASTVQVVVHGVPSDADLPWSKKVAVAPSYPDQLRAAVAGHHWLEADDPALGMYLHTVVSVAAYLGDTGSTPWTVSGEQRMGHRALTIKSSGESAAEVELLVRNHPDPVRGPTANDPSLSITVSLPLAEGRHSEAAAAIAALASGHEAAADVQLRRSQSARTSLQRSLDELFGQHRPPRAKVRMWTIGDEQRVQVTAPAVAETVSASGPVTDHGTKRPPLNPHRLVEEFAAASGLAADMVRFYWPVLLVLEDLVRVMSDVPVDESITAEQITDFAERVAKAHGDVPLGPQTVRQMLDATRDAQSYGLLEQGASRVVHQFELGAVMHLSQLDTEETGGSGTLGHVVPTVPDCPDPRAVMKRYWLISHENNPQYWVDGAAAEHKPVTLEQLRTWTPSRTYSPFDYWDTVEYVLRNYDRDEYPGVFDRRSRHFTPPYTVARIIEDDTKILRGIFRMLREFGIRPGSLRSAIDLGGGSNLYPAMMNHLMVRKDGRVVRLVYWGNQPELLYNRALSDLDGDGLLHDIAPARDVSVVDTRRPWLKWVRTVVNLASEHFDHMSEKGLLRRAMGSEVVPGEVFEFSPLGVLSPLGLMTAPRSDIGSDFYAIDSVFTIPSEYFAALLCELNAVNKVLISGWTINNGEGYSSGTSWYPNTTYDKALREGFLRNHPRMDRLETVEHKAPASFSENDEGLAANVAVLRPPALEIESAELAELDELRRHLVSSVSETVPETLREQLVTESRLSHNTGPRVQQVNQLIRNAMLSRAGLPADSLGEFTAQLMEDTAKATTRLQAAGLAAESFTHVVEALEQYHAASVRIFGLRRQRAREELGRQHDKIVEKLRAIVPAEHADELAVELVTGADQLESAAKPQTDPVYARLHEDGVAKSAIDELSGAVAYYLGLAHLIAIADAQARASA